MGEAGVQRRSAREQNTIKSRCRTMIASHESRFDAGVRARQRLSSQSSKEHSPDLPISQLVAEIVPPADLGLYERQLEKNTSERPLPGTLFRACIISFIE